MCLGVFCIMKKNPYKIKQGYLQSPYRHLSIDNDVPISKADHIQKLLDEAIALDEKIAGDFELFDLLGAMQDYRLGFVRIGLYAFQLKKFKLYKEVSSSFHKFCQEYFHKGADYVDKLIQAASDVLELISHGFGEILPQNEAQARSLRSSAKKAGTDIVEAWQFVCDRYQEQPWKITHKTINTAICGEVPEEPNTLTKVVLPIVLVDKVQKLAIKAGMGFTEFLLDLFQIAEKSYNLTDKKRQERWEEEEEINQEYYKTRFDSA